MVTSADVDLSFAQTAGPCPSTKLAAGDMCMHLYSLGVLMKHAASNPCVRRSVTGADCYMPTRTGTTIVTQHFK